MAKHHLLVSLVRLGPHAATDARAKACRDAHAKRLGKCSPSDDGTEERLLGASATQWPEYLNRMAVHLDRKAVQ